MNRRLHANRYRGVLCSALVCDARITAALVEKMGWPTPPRSACWMCPNQSGAEWRDLKTNHPGEVAAACALEIEVQKVDPAAWLHASCVPLSEVDFTAPDDLFADRACSSGGCFT